MGTISQKIEYLNTTKQRQKNLINALGGNITNDTPFREYEQELIGVLPKVTGEGTNFSLSPTIEYDLEVESLLGDTKQNTLTGKNLLDYNTRLNTTGSGLTCTINSDGSITATGIPAYNYASIMSFKLEQYVTLENGAKYTISMGSSNSYLYLQINDTNNDTSQTSYYSLSSGTSATFTAYSNHTYLFRLQTTTTSNWGESSRTITNTYQLEKSASATSFEKYCGGIPSPNPNYPQDIQVVTGTQTVEINGKNFWEFEQEITGNSARTRTFTKPLVAGTYRFSLYVQNSTAKAIDFYNGSTKIKNCFIAVHESLTRIDFSLSVTDKCTSLQMYSGGASDVMKDFQIEKGSTMTSFEPYQTSQTYTLHLGDEELYDEGFISEEGDKWYINNSYEKYLGKLSYPSTCYNATYQRIDCYIPDNKTAYGNVTLAKCNKFNNTPNASVNSVNTNASFIVRPRKY